MGSTGGLVAVSGLGRIGRNTAWLLAGRVLGQGLMVLFTVVLAGRLGLVGLGEYAFVAAVVFLANVVTTFGTDMVLIRDIAAAERAAAGRAAEWPAALAVQLLLSALAIAMIWVTAPLVPSQSRVVVAALRLYSLSLVPSAVFSVCSAGLRGAGRMGSYAAVGAAAAAIQLGAVWVVVSPGADLTVVASVVLAVQVMVAAVAWAVCAAWIPAFRGVPRVAASDVRGMARCSARIGILGLLGVLYQRAGVLALSMFAGPAATGWFAGASRVVEASRTGHVALFGALYPAMAEAHAAAEAGQSSAGGLGWAWQLSVLGAAAISASLFVLSSLTIELLYGPAFAPSAGALGILALSVVPSTVATHQSLELLAAHREALTLRALLASLVVLVALLAALVPIAGWIGACWAVLGAEIVLAGTLLALRRHAFAAAVRRAPPLWPSPRIVDGARELPERS